MLYEVITENEPVKTEPVTPKKEPKMEEASKTPAAKTVVIMETSMGTITIELNAEKAPKTVANFLRSSRTSNTCPRFP